MTLVDVNLLLYAEDTGSPQHHKAKSWWDEQLSGPAPVCLCWPVLTAFIRIATNPRVYSRPLSISQAAGRVEEWLEQTCTRELAHLTPARY